MAAPLSPAALAARIARLPRANLAALPTPLEDCPRLGAALGIRLLVKRDDLTGLAFGGNKVRGAEFRLPALQASGADTVVIAREPDSNNARVTIAACRKLGLDAVLIVPDAEPADWQGSLLIDHLLGANIRFAPGGPAAVQSMMDATLRELHAAGKRPVDHDAGETAQTMAAVAYVATALELHQQCSARGVQPDWVFVVSEGPTQAGLALGARCLGLGWRVAGVTYGERSGDQREGIARVANAAAAALDLDVTLAPEEIISLRDYAGPAFKALTPEAHAAIALAASTEGLLLDPIYTGKGMAGLRDQVQRGNPRQGATVVFVHTGGLPALFRYGRALTRQRE